MAVTNARYAPFPLHPLHAVLLASPLPLFLGALLSDWAYSATYQIQWINFASWLIAGALILVGMALVWSFVDRLRADHPSVRSKWLLVALVAATFVLGFINALIHAKDGWATMPAGLILSIFVFILAVASAWSGFSAVRSGEPR